MSRANKRSALSAFFILLSSLSTFAQARPALAPAREIPAALTSRHAQLKAKLQPSARTWVEQQGRSEAQKSAPDISSLKAEISSRFGTCKPGEKPGINCLGAGDIEAVAFIVMMEAAKSAHDDLKRIMEEIKKSTDNKKKLRDDLNKVARVINSSAGNKKDKTCPEPTCRELSELAAKIAPLSNQPVRYNFSGVGTLAEAKAAVDSLKQDLDSIGEMSQEQTLRLQMAMDRKSQLETMLSNVMKAGSDTQSSIIGNLK